MVRRVPLGGAAGGECDFVGGGGAPSGGGRAAPGRVEFAPVSRRGDVDRADVARGGADVPTGPAPRRAERAGAATGVGGRGVESSAVADAAGVLPGASGRAAEVGDAGAAGRGFVGGSGVDGKSRGVGTCVP